MPSIISPEILWSIFTLVESDADLARAGRVSKFVGAIALDVLWNDIHFESFLSLFPTRTPEVPTVPNPIWHKRCTNIVIPILPRHWERANPYALRVRTLRRDWTGKGMGQILTTLKLYDRGSEKPFIFPRLRRLIWDCGGDAHELSLIAPLFFTPGLQELSIQSLECYTENEFPQPESIRLPCRLALLVPLKMIMEINPNLRKLQLPLPALPSESLKNYHSTVVDLLRQLPKWPLQDVSLCITKEIIDALSTFPNLQSLELHDHPFHSQASRIFKNTATFENLRSLTLNNVHSRTSLGYLIDFQCAPSHHIEIDFACNVIDSTIFSEVIRLLHPRRGTLESLEVQLVNESMNLTAFSEWLLTIPNMKKLCLGPGITLDIRDDILELISSEWKNLSYLAISDAGYADTYISCHGMVRPHIRGKRSLELCFTLPEAEGDAEIKIVDLASISRWLLTFPDMKELFLGPGITFNIQDDMLRLMGTKLRKLACFRIGNNGNLVTLSGIMSLSHCPIQSLAISFTLTQKDIDHLRQLINNSEISPFHSLTNFMVDELINGFGTNVSGAVFVLACLFPNAELGISFNSKVIPDRYVQEALQARNVVLKMSKTMDMHNLMQIVGKDELIAHQGDSI